jgi:hypothetical protein
MGAPWGGAFDDGIHLLFEELRPSRMQVHTRIHTSLICDAQRICSPRPLLVNESADDIEHNCIDPICFKR